MTYLCYLCLCTCACVCVCVCVSGAVSKCERFCIMCKHFVYLWEDAFRGSLAQVLWRRCKAKWRPLFLLLPTYTRGISPFNTHTHTHTHIHTYAHSLATSWNSPTNKLINWLSIMCHYWELVRQTVWPKPNSQIREGQLKQNMIHLPSSLSLSLSLSFLCLRTSLSSALLYLPHPLSHPPSLPPSLCPLFMNSPCLARRPMEKFLVCSLSQGQSLVRKPIELWSNSSL